MDAPFSQFRRGAMAGLTLAATVSTGCTTMAARDGGAAPVASTTRAAADPLDRAAPDTMRWLYGSGEAAAASLQAYRWLADYAVTKARQRSVPRSVPMGLPDAPGGIDTPECVDAGGRIKPLAAVFDVDETVLLNSGYEYWSAQGHPYDADDFADWADNGAAHAAPVPGAVAGLKRLRDAGITVIFNTNRKAENAAGTAAAIEAAGLGPAVRGETLFLAGDDALGGDKDGRRATIAAHYCVIALAGDNLGDFANVFNQPDRAVQARRALASAEATADLWGNGWFILPNPVYGPGVAGTLGDVFAPQTRWAPARARTQSTISEGE